MAPGTFGKEPGMKRVWKYALSALAAGALQVPLAAGAPLPGAGLPPAPAAVPSPPTPGTAVVPCEEKCAVEEAPAATAPSCQPPARAGLLGGGSFYLLRPALGGNTAFTTFSSPRASAGVV